jgi:hypothetical protein
MFDRIELGIEALRRLNPHPQRYAKYIPGRGQYVQISQKPTDDVLEQHIRGTALLGAVAADDSGTTDSVGLDLDGHTTNQDPLGAAKKFITTAQALDIPVVLHSSKGGRGYHLRTLFRSRVPCWLARALFVALAMAAGISGDNAMDKVWPPSRGFGVLALPYQSGFAMQTGGTIALNQSTFEPLPASEQIEAVTECEECDREDAEALLSFMGVNTVEDAKILAGSPRAATNEIIKDGTDGGLHVMAEHCAAVKRLFDEAATVKYEFWFGMMTNFKPFHGGRDVFRAFSKLDVARWDEVAFDRSWKAITGKPRLCENLERGWVCPKRAVCDARAPAGLPFAIKRQERRFEAPNVESTPT